LETRRIFISHAVKDKKLADMFVDLITASAAVTPEEIFCTSLEGLGIPAGKDFLDVIKNELQEPELIISLISPNYLQSQFCLCELGASWAMSHNNLPLLVPPLTYADLSPVISTKQAILLNDTSALNGMLGQIIKILNKEDVNQSRWEAKRNDFISRFNKEFAVAYECLKPQQVVVVSEGSTPDSKFQEFKKMFADATSTEEKEDVLLVLLSEQPDFRMQMPDIAEALNIKRVVCQYHIDSLIDKQFVELTKVEGFLGFHINWHYTLNKAGRHFLVENGKV
jgi:hypothetical protein